MILNLVNGDHYIGSTKDFHNRIESHKGELEKNIHINDYLQRAWNKYGCTNFSFIHLFRATLRSRKFIEQFCINTFPSQYNLMRIIGDSCNFCHSDETKKKIGFASLGRRLSDAAKEKISMKNIGKKRSIGAREKMAAKKRGRKLPEHIRQAFIQAGRNASLGRVVSETTKLKISIACKGRKRKPHSEETKRKMSEARKSWWANGI